MALADQPKLIGLAATETWRRLKRSLRTSSRTPFNLSGPTPERVYLAPQDMRTSDPTVAQDLYAGNFTLGGQTVVIRSESPFTREDCGISWTRALHGFRWIRHLKSETSPVSQAHAQIMVKDWITYNDKQINHVAWEVDVAASRLIAWLSNSVSIVETADHAFYRLFLKSIGRHIRYLRGQAIEADDGYPRLAAYIALAYASVCVSDQKYMLRSAPKNLDLELERQFFADGGHISRNPAIIPEVLAYLLPLRESYARVEQSPSPVLVATIDRLMTALKFFRHRDGTLARFNSTGITEGDLIATILRYDDTLGQPSESFTASGYERLACGNTTLVMDTGKPPRGVLSTRATAGTLSFELSSDQCSIIVNCGAPPNSNEQHVTAARSTAAHSTVVMNDSSSCRFNTSGAVAKYLDRQIISGPSIVSAERSDTSQEKVLVASHDGYVRPFGVVHHRSVSLSQDGNRLLGADRFSTPSGEPPIHVTKDEAVARFHLHPLVRPGKVQVHDAGAQSVELLLPNGVKWRLTCLDTPVELEESAFFAHPSGLQPTSQIVLKTNVSERCELRWALEKTS